MATVEYPSWYGKCDHMRLDGLNETANPFVAAVDIFRGVIMTFKCYGKLNSTNYFNDVIEEIKFQWTYDFYDVAVVLGLAVIWTIVRHFLVRNVIEPTAHGLGVLEKNVEKFGESVWKFTAYGFMWSVTVYVTFFRGYDFFENTIQMWSDVKYNWAPFDLCVVYALEASYYVHAIYATLYMDAWRKDSIVMLLHHFVTLTLIIGSYAFGFLKIGIIVVLLDDIGDVILELSKALSYLRYRKSGFSRFFDIVSTATGVLFGVQWAVLRLQMHLTKILRTGAIGVWVSFPMLPVPGHLFFVAFLTSLYFFYVYWFVFIVMFLLRILFGSHDDLLDDPREEAQKKQQIAAELKKKGK